MNKQCTVFTTLGLGIVLLAVATCFLPLQNQLASAQLKRNIGAVKLLITNPAGSNMTTGSNITGSNMTGAAGNTTGGAHGSPVPTTHSAGCCRY